MRADPSLPHQIRLDGESGTGRILVKCNCRGDTPLGILTSPGDSPWPIYNRKELHDNRKVEFVPRAHHTQNQEVYFVD